MLGSCKLRLKDPKGYPVCLFLESSYPNLCLEID